MPVSNESVGSRTSQLKTSNIETSSIKTNGISATNKQKNIDRCVDLLEHAGRCQGSDSCAKREECRRTKQVLAHYRKCSRGIVCVVCSQLRALCLIHAQRCQNDPTGEEINTNEQETEIRAQSSRPLIPKKRKVERHLKTEEMKRQALVQKAFATLNQEADEFDALGKTYAAKLRRMDVTQRDIADKLINEILFKGLQNHLTFNTTVSNF